MVRSGGFQMGGERETTVVGILFLGVLVAATVTAAVVVVMMAVVAVGVKRVHYLTTQ